jgi:hypothetical protein
MIVTARAGIDEAMIVNPGRIRARSAVSSLPAPDEFSPAPVVPWQPKPWGRGQGQDGNPWK